jgi:TRAP-type transport system periplasmic protein
MKPHRIVSQLLFVFVLLSFASVANAKVTIKCATLAPKGSSWAKLMDDYNKSVKEKTKGEVEFSMFAGGVLGDEIDVVKKMRIGQVHCAGLTGNGLGQVNAALRVMELPMLLQTHEQADKAFAKMTPDLEKLLDQKGYVLLGWAHPGFVQLLSKIKIDSHAKAKTGKIFIWSTDPLAKFAVEALGMNGIPLSVADVLQSLSTGMIDTVYCPPLACLALQWHTKTQYLTKVNMVHVMGALIIKKSIFNKVSPSAKKVLLSEGKLYMRKLVEQTRIENQQAIAAMEAGGMEIIPIADVDKQVMIDASKEAWKKATTDFVPPALLNKVKASIK